MSLRENDLLFRFDGSTNAVKFDDGAHNNDSIQPVDFLVEYVDRYRFVEVKDPDAQDARNVEAFRQKFRSGQLIRKLAGKYRDTVFSVSLQDRPKKSIEYVVLLAMAELSPQVLIRQTDLLRKSIPVSHEKWRLDSAVACMILNLGQYKSQFGADSVLRVSEQTGRGL